MSVNNSDTKTDAELIRHVQAGNKAAFDVLVLKYQSRVLTLIRRYINDVMEAEDVAQETFIKAYKGLVNFRGESAFYTWLYRIAVNTAKNYLTANARRQVGHAVGVDDSEQDFLDSHTSQQDLASPDALLMAEEARVQIMASIDNLPRKLREVIKLRELDGFSYEEIASIMDCPVGTVRSRIFRARDAIETALNKMVE